MEIYKKSGDTTVIGGGVTSLTAGPGITLTPNPITGVGVISVTSAILAPSVVLVLSPVAGFREFGNIVTNPTLTPTTTKHTNNITTLTLAGTNGYSFSYPTPNPAGATEATQTDTDVISTTQSFTATVGDGSLTGINTQTYSFVYPIYYGSDVDGLTGAQIRSNLTHLITNPTSMTLTFSPNANRVYFVYPATAPDLVSILDINSFNVTADFPQTLINITGLDLTVQSYKVYEINHNVGTGLPTTYTFNF